MGIVMQKYLINTTIAGALLLLAGCQTGSGPGLFSSYPSYPPYSSRMNLAQSVQDALIRNGDPVIAQVRVETNQNIVILSGYVKKIRQSDVAEQIAGQVAGPQNVQNNIIVRP
jgi:hyperosmotically inducible protein